MSNDNSSIHDFDVQLICEYFSNFERQGPGSPQMTILARGFIQGLTQDARIADLGCGTGGQSMVLAQHAPGQITGIDLFPKFIELFNENAAHLGLQQRVKGVVGTMEDLPFQKEELDLIWSEGAIYNIGFERGLKEWKDFLKPGGYVAITEACWFTNERPEEIHNFWVDAYPGIDTIPNKLAQLQNAGYIPVATFILPEECWEEHFYFQRPQADRIFLEKYPGNAQAEWLVNNQTHEAELYSRYKAFYGYVFFIGKKI
jgi:SAM-dependent methyltransferase